MTDCDFSFCTVHAKEVDSLENTEPQAYGEHQEQHASFGPQ